MKKLLFIILVLIGFTAHSQIYTPATVTIYGAHNMREKIDSVILLPSGCGRPSHLKYNSTDTLHMALYGDTCAHKAYLFFPGRGWVPVIDSASSTGLYVRVADTSAMLSNYMRKSNNLSDVASIPSARYNLNVVNLTTGVDSVNISAGDMVDKIILTDPAGISVSMGTTRNSRNICPIFSISAGGYSTINLTKYYATTQTLYFNGVTSSTIIKLYKQ